MMNIRYVLDSQSKVPLKWNAWVKVGLKAALASIAAVLAVQAIALAIWPAIAAFGPLDSYPRSALFTLVPVIGATGLFAWLVKTREKPVSSFIKISLVVLALSFIPDYVIPHPSKTFLASSVAAFMHLVAGVVTIVMIIKGYRHEVKTQS
jgi:hypothetical protein